MAVLEKKWNDITKAILISSLFFAAIHFNPYWLIQIYFLGLLLGYIAWKTASEIPAIIFHIVINGSSLLFTHLGDSIESTLLWNGHINPLILVLGGYCFFTGMKQIQGIS